MKIAIMGRRSVGSTLGPAWEAAGHSVRFGRRDPGEEDEMAHGEAAEWGDVVVLATPARAALELVTSLGPLEGKIVFDCTNPLLPGLSGLDHEDGRSGAERVAEAASQAGVVKAFNSVGANVMASPVLDGRKAMMPFCGPGDGSDAEAVEVVAGLVADVGFEPVHVGPLGRARQLEHLALLWIRMSMDTDLGRDFAFGLLRHRVEGALGA